jgi:predicted outer membrane repeat protein
MGHNNVVQNNTATSAGGAFYVDEDITLHIEGRLCASGNSASERGGFAVAIGQLAFVEGSEVYLPDSTPDTILLLFGSVRCGEAAPSWARTVAGTVYSITGRACACNASFVDGTSTICVSDFPACPASTWDQETCACVSAA